MGITPQAVGISWECASSAHAGCHTAGCRCMCHYHPAIAAEGRERISVPIERIPTPPNNADVLSASPRRSTPCGHPYREGDKFCRKCGVSLTIAHCGQCGNQVDAGDLYCNHCGASTSSEIAQKTP